MSSFGVIDPTIGIPYFDLRCAPAVAVAKFPFLRTTKVGVSTPRIYLATLGTEIISAEPHAIPVVVVITYDSMLVGNLDNGKLTHRMVLAEDILGCLTTPIDKASFAVLGNASSGGDCLLKIPVTQDRQKLEKVLSALLKHHTMRTLEIQQQPTFSEIRNKVQLDGKSGVLHRLGDPVEIPHQMFSVINMQLPFVSDRMGDVKRDFEQTDSETKESLASMAHDMNVITGNVDAEILALRQSINGMYGDIAVEEQRAQELTDVEKHVEFLKVQTEEGIREYNALQIQFSLDLEEWGKLVQSRQSGELKQRHVLLQQQRRHQEEYAALRAEIKLLEGVAAARSNEIESYDGLDYSALLTERDHALEVLKDRAEELEHLHSPECQLQKKMFSRSVRETLLTNKALRRLFEKLGSEIAEETRKHDELRQDMENLDSDIHEFGDHTLIAAAQLDGLRDQNEISRIEAGKVDKSIIGIKDDKGESKEARSFYLVARQKLNAAITRREELQHAAKEESKQRKERRSSLQQKLFAEKIRGSWV